MNRRTMPSSNRLVLHHLEREEREIYGQLSILRRQEPVARIADLAGDGSIIPFEAAVLESIQQHEEVVRRRLAERSRDLAAAIEQIRDGTYGICRTCRSRIPRRRMVVLPTATLCVTCQEQLEILRR